MYGIVVDYSFAYQRFSCQTVSETDSFVLPISAAVLDDVRARETAGVSYDGRARGGKVRGRPSATLLRVGFVGLVRSVRDSRNALRQSIVSIAV